MSEKSARRIVVLGAAFIIAFAAPGLPRAEAENCLKCHPQLTKGKFVHKALNMACVSCHSGIDGRTVPHRKTNNAARGLASEKPDLCFGCHDRELFSGKVVHVAIGIGCTACHEPHTSKNAKLLKSAVPGLCFACHEDAAFTKKEVHSPVAAGRCVTCHAAHASDQMALLSKKPIDVCLQCHKDIPHGRHMSSPQANGQEGAAGEFEPQDPQRPGKPFYCGSCHDPHSTDSPLLFRFNAQSAQDLCVHCHKMN